MTAEMKFASGLTLPLSIVTEKNAMLGVTGSGKTYAATKLAELLWDAGAQFVALDPVGVWYGLRLAKDGKTSGIPIPVFGGLHGDVPLEPGAGALMANLIVDRGISAVLDVSQFETDAAKARFAKDFAERFFFRKKASASAVHVFLEECQEFVPQNPQGGEQQMLHAFHRLQKLGRNFGVGLTLISQRPQEVNKKALNQSQTLFVFRLTGPQERKAVDGWVSEKGLDQDIAGDLPKLKTGDCHVWSPTFLGISDMIVTVNQKRTFNASATPEVGVAAVKRELAPIDLEKIRTEMSATIERAKAEDPKELQKQLRDARAQLTKLQKAGQPATGAGTKSVVADPRAIDRAVKVALAPYEERLTLITRQLRPIARLVNSAADVFTNARTGLEHLLALPPITVGATNGNGDSNSHPARAPLVGSNTQGRATGRRFGGATPEQTSRTTGANSGVTAPRVQSRQASRDSGSTLSGLSKRIIDSLAALDQLGVDQPDRAQLAAFANSTPGNGHFKNTLGGLNSTGLVEYPTPGFVRLTEAGRSQADVARAPSSLDELHDQFRRRLSGLGLKVYEVAIVAYPDDISRDELAAAIDPPSTATNGHFKNTLGELRTLGVIDYPTPGRVRATDVLFPDGLS